MSMRKYKMTLASLSTPLRALQKRSEHEVISLMIHLNIFMLKVLNLLGFAFHLRFTNVCIMFLADLLFQIVDSIQKISPHFQPYLQTIAQKVTLFIKDANYFLRKIKSLVNFRKNIFSALLMLLLFTLISHMRKAWPHLASSQMQRLRKK